MNSTWTVPSSTATSRTTPRSTIEIDGISGSSISASAAQTCVDGYHAAPGTERRTSVISSQSAELRRCARRARRPAGAAPRALRGARLVLQPLVPHLGVHAVVRLLAVDLRGEPGDRRIVGRHQRAEPPLVRRLVEVRAARSSAPSPERSAARRAASTGTPPACGRTRARRRRPHPRHELVDRPRVADLVLRDRRERDVLLEQRRDARSTPSSRQPRTSSSSAIGRSSCARSLTCLRQLRLQGIAVDPVVVPVQLVDELLDLEDRSRATTQSATDSPRRPNCSCAYALAYAASGASTEPACANGYALSLLPEDLPDHAASASTRARTHSVSSRVMRRSSSRSASSARAR